MLMSDLSSDVFSSDLGVSNDQLADGFAFIALCQAPFECLAQPRFRERLRHEVDDAVLECFEGAVGIRGDDDGIERTGNRALQQVKAIAAMKVQIEEKDIRHRQIGRASCRESVCQSV